MGKFRHRFFFIDLPQNRFAAKHWPLSMNGNSALTIDDIAAVFSGKAKRPSGGIFYTIGLFAVRGL